MTQIKINRMNQSLTKFCNAPSLSTTALRTLGLTVSYTYFIHAEKGEVVGIALVSKANSSTDCCARRAGMTKGMSSKVTWIKMVR